MRRRALLLLACLAAPCSLALGQAAGKDAFSDEFARLSKEYRDAQNAYFEPYQKAKTDEERNKIQLDPTKDPSRIYFAKFRALAKKADGTATGAKATMWIAQLAPSVNDKAAAKDAYKTLVTKYADKPEAEQAVLGLRYAGYTIGQNEARSLLRMTIEKGDGKLKAAALFTLGANLLDDRSTSNKDEARKLFTQLKRDYPNSPHAKRADGAIFEMENLQIGKAAPDFEATDENGKKFKLSDYRGKVVVLDFWGWW
jgi:hypothetical protein